MSEKIQPFSNLTEFDSWTTRNCDMCCRYSNVSSVRKNAKCKLAFDLDLACVTDGEISLNTANKIGYDGTYLNRKCNDFNKPIIRKKYPKKIKNQTELFEPCHN